MKTRQELNVEYWGRVHDMCKGTDIEGREWKCVRNNGADSSGHPVFILNPSVYQIAVTILEDNPVFEGDRLYHIESGEIYSVEGCGATLMGFQSIGTPHDWINSSDFSKCLTFTPPAPKRTFQLNGVDLPCPDAKGQTNSDPHELIIGSRKQGYACEYFNEFVFSEDQSFEVFKAIRDVLLKARDQ